MKTLACVGLGGNVGDVARTLDDALVALAALPETRLLRASRVYRTPAWGRIDQADFLNAAATLQTSLPARRLLEHLLDIEQRLGRDRSAGAERWGPRTLDLDLLLYGEAVIDEAGLRVPHPRLHERAFALVPLAEIAAGAMLPGRGSVAAALAALDADGIKAIP